MNLSSFAFRSDRMDNLFDVTLVLLLSVWTYDVISGHGAHRSHASVGEKSANFHDDSVIQDKE